MRVYLHRRGMEMGYDLALEGRIRSVVDEWENVSSKKMFGGVCFLMTGNMFCGVHRKDLILRLGERQAAAALPQKYIKPFDITGRPMKGWVMVEPMGIGAHEALLKWLTMARDFALTLPPK